MSIPLLDLKAQYHSIKDEIQNAINEVLESQHFILGPKVRELEQKIAQYCQCRFALGVSSGTDALLLALMAYDVGPDDIVVTTPFTFFSTAGCIARLGAKPEFVDIDHKTFNMDPAKLEALLGEMDTERRSHVKAVIPVHLFGQMADMERIIPICDRYGIPVIEDAAQAIGAECCYKGRIHRAGTIGAIGCFSFFPSKNLGGYGDGGMVVTNDEDLYKKMKLLRAHGSEPKYYHKVIGGNFRLDEIQAAVLIVKLGYLDAWSEKRRKNADLYNLKLNFLNGGPLHLPPAEYKDVEGIRNYHIYNQYCIRAKNRDALMHFLKSREIGTEIYYPLPLHLQECFSSLGYAMGSFPKSELCASEALAVPVYPELGETNIDEISESILTFYHQ